MPQPTTFQDKKQAALRDRETLHNRLLEAGLTQNRFFSLPKGQKGANIPFLEEHKTVFELETFDTIGVKVGNGLIILDIDNDNFEGVKKLFGETFTAKSGGKGKPHYYYKIDSETKFPEATIYCEFGEIKCERGYCVSPGSHLDYYDTSKKKRIIGDYTILLDIPIKTINQNDFFTKIKSYKKIDEKPRLTEEEIQKGFTEGERHTNTLKLTQQIITNLGIDFSLVFSAVQTFNNNKNKPPLPEEELKRIVKDCIEFRKKNPSIKTEESKFIEKGDSNQLNMGFVLEVLNQQKYICPIDTEKVLIFNEGVYENAKPFIYKTLEGIYGKFLKKHFCEEAYAHIQRANYVKRSIINQYTNSIPIKNGLFNFYFDTLNPFDATKIFTYKLNAEYIKDAKCPNWLKFVEEILPEKDAQKLLQEIMGYCLLPKMPFHKIFWFYGTGRNGKGVVIRTLEEILGKDNCSALNLSEFSESRRFGLCKLYGKLLNASSEPKLSEHGLQTTVLKMVTGQDTIYAEMKGKDERLQFVNFAKLIVLGNHFPKVEDNSLGWWDRVETLKFPNSFDGDKNVPNIEEKWLPDEIPGIFNWMLEGLYRLKEQNGFTTTKTTEETKKEFMKQSDPFNAWILEKCQLIAKSYMINEEAYNKFNEYCDENEYDRITKRTFYEKMRTTKGVTEKQKMIDGKNKRVFEGVSLAFLADIASFTNQEITENNTNEYTESANSANSANITQSSLLHNLTTRIKDTIRKNDNPMIKRSFITEKIKELQFKDDVETVLKHLKTQVPELSIINDLSIDEMLGGGD